MEKYCRLEGVWSNNLFSSYHLIIAACEAKLRWWYFCVFSCHSGPWSTSAFCNHQKNVHEEFHLINVFTDVLMFCTFIYGYIFVLWLLKVNTNLYDSVRICDKSPFKTGSAKWSQLVVKKIFIADMLECCYASMFSQFSYRLLMLNHFVLLRFVSRDCLGPRGNGNHHVVS